MNEIKKELTLRLKRLEAITDKGVIPGELDTYELAQLIGRVMELSFIIDLIGDMCSD